jgi:hypothetical protein
VEGCVRAGLLRNVQRQRIPTTEAASMGTAFTYMICLSTISTYIMQNDEEVVASSPFLNPTTCKESGESMGKANNSKLSLEERKSFDQAVKALRGLHSPKCTRKVKANCTPLEWARNLDYEKNRTRDRQERSKANKKLYRKKSQDLEFMRLQSERSSEYRRANLDKVKARQKRHNSKESVKVRRRLKRKNPFVRQKENAYAKRKYKTDPQFRMACCLRARFHKKVTVKNRSLGTFDLVGTSPVNCAKHLESLFDEGMSWDNYGSWHIDHVIPLCSFNLDFVEEQKKAFHYTNLQPLWAEDNMRKGARIQ